MGEHELALLIPIVAIVMAFASRILKSVLASQERRIQLKNGADTKMAAQLAALRTELAELRDTSTQFDMSLHDAVERLEQRVGRVETKTATQGIKIDQPEQVQRIELP